MSTDSGVAARLPPSFVQFLRDNNIDVRIFENMTSIPRFIRLNPRNRPDMGQLESELGCPLTQTPLSDFFALDPNVKIASTHAYKSGQIFGIDIASGACVAAMQICRGDNVLDLCCAPGAKLCMISDLISDTQQAEAAEPTEAKLGCVVGVDISEQRLATCKTMVNKYTIQNAALCLSDGRLFNFGPDSARSDAEVDSKKRKLTGRQMRRLKQFQPTPASTSSADDTETNACFPHVSFEQIDALPAPTSYYDKVLVDAQCTHDGSIRHVLKYLESPTDASGTDKWDTDSFQRRALDKNNLTELEALQRGLLLNGFRLLRPGGSLIYSTCSFCVAQNEAVVQWLFDRLGADRVQLQPFSSSEKAALGAPQSDHAALRGCLRFGAVENECGTNSEPNQSHLCTSGLFVARLLKLS